MKVTFGTPREFSLEESKSQYLLPTLKVFFSDSLAEVYKPIIYSGDQSYDHENISVQPEGMYYRIIFNPSLDEYCIQYYVYWLDQDCTSIIGISNHKYDYEPIYVYVKPSEVLPVGIINSGESKVLGLNQCRLHKTEIRRKEYSTRDDVESPCSFKTSPGPYYPFGGSSGIEGRNCSKKYPIAGSIYFSDCRPLFGIASCFHPFSGAENLLKGEQISVSLKRLDEDTLSNWYNEHRKSGDEEPFGHDVSNPFEFPFIKYVDVKPFFDS